jgi:hypothetical protein
MDARVIRDAVVEGLEAGGVGPIHRVAIRGPFLAGDLDLTLAELEMDSLAKMELCIAIEVGTGVSLAPEELDRYGTLGALVAEVEGRLRA